MYRQHGLALKLAVLETPRRWDSPLRGIREPEQLEQYVHQRLQIKIGEICSACVSVVRGVQVRTGIPSQSDDHVDGKLGALRVMGAGFLLVR